MADRIITTKKDHETPGVMYKRFQKKFRTSGIQKVLKNKKYNERKPSKTIRKKDCLNKLKQRAKFEKAYRLGQIPSHSVYKKQ